MSRLRGSSRRVLREERAGRELRAVQPEYERAAEAEVVDRVGDERLRAVLAELPPEQRTAIERAYFANQTHVQIAEVLGVPLGTVKSRLSLGLRKLQTLLPPEDRP